MEAKARELEITWLDKSAPMLLHKLRSFMQVGAQSRAGAFHARTHTPIRAYVPVPTHPRTHPRAHTPRRATALWLPPIRQTELGFGEFGFRTAHDAPIIQARHCTRCAARSSHGGTVIPSGTVIPRRHGYPTAARVSRTAWPNRSAHYSGHCGHGRSRAPHFA